MANDTPAHRLRQARLAAGFRTATEAAEKLQMNRATYIGHENGNRTFGPDQAAEYGAKYNVRASWLLYGDGEGPVVRELVYVPVDERGEEISDEPFIGEGYNRQKYQPKIPGAIPELDVRAGAGEGVVGEVVVLPMDGGTISAHKVIEEWYLPGSYLREAVRDPRQAIVMAVDGDSMMPNYAPGDRVIIDLSQDHFEADGVYLISYDFRHPQVKRLQAMPLTVPPKVRIISDNSALYSPFEAELDLLRIHGKVCAYVGRR